MNSRSEGLPVPSNARRSVPPLLNTAAQDGKRVRIGFGKDPGQAGKSQTLHLVRALSGFTAVPAAESGDDKTTRFGPFSSQCRVGNVKILRGLWNDDLFRVLEGIPDLAHDDEVDACNGALEMLNPDMKGYGMFQFYRRQAEQLRAGREGRGEAAQPTQPTWAIGSTEWLAEQNKSTEPAAPAPKYLHESSGRFACIARKTEVTLGGPKVRIPPPPAGSPART